MPVQAVVARVQHRPREPLPKRPHRGIKHPIPRPIPGDALSLLGPISLRITHPGIIRLVVACCAGHGGSSSIFVAPPKMQIKSHRTRDCATAADMVCPDQAARRNPMQINGLAALVTGGGSGLGAATAQHLAALGAKVAVADINQSAAEAMAAK